MKPLPVELLPLADLDVPDYVQRETSLSADDQLRRSIERGGIQEPLVVVRHEGRNILAKGGRRYRVAQALGIPKARCVIDSVPKGQTPESYIRRVRFILGEHRQDLLPSVRAGVIQRLKEQLGLNSGQLAAYLGIDPDTVTHWMAVGRYIPEIVSAIDQSALTMDAARCFNGLSTEGQKALWRAHKSELCEGMPNAHKRMRAQYPPKDFPAYYEDADKAQRRLKAKRKARVTYTPDEKKSLLASAEVKRAELDECQADIATMKRQCQAAGPVVAAILRQKALKAMVPASVVPELERFAEVY